MSRGIQSQTGPYMHAADAKWVKEFDGGRRFIVLIAGAYKAGIVGPEHNGIVVLDDNAKAVILDQHAQEMSGYEGPSQAQMREARRIMEMDWQEFTEFCRNHPRYRSWSLADAYEAAPSQFPGLPTDVVYPRDAKEGQDLERFPLERKDEIIEFLSNRQTHTGRDGVSHRLAWDIKVYDFDTSGKHSDEPVEDRFDKKWEETLEAHPEIFGMACADALSYYTNEEFSTSADDQGHYAFEVGGRSGGWLMLKRVEGIGEDLRWTSKVELEDFLLDLEDDQLVKLYRAVADLDQSITPVRIKEEMEYQYSVTRARFEDGWKLEAEDDMEPENDADPDTPGMSI